MSPHFRIVTTSIPVVPGVSRVRYFVEYVDGLQITDVGNFETELEAERCREAIVAMRDGARTPFSFVHLSERNGCHE